MLPQRLRASHLLFLCPLPLLAAAATAGAQTTPAPTVITSCVSKLSGVSRIVATPAACHAGVEIVVQWNQQGPQGLQGSKGDPGPQGANGTAGATGPAGMALPHVIIVPATADPDANGQALYTAIHNISGASLSQPYLIQLDAGTFTAPSNYIIPAYVSLRGQGAASTIINGYYSLYVAENAATAASISDLTLGGATDLVFFSQGSSTLTIHGVVANYEVYIASNGGAVTARVYDSVFNLLQLSGNGLVTRVYDSVVSTVFDGGVGTLTGAFVGSEINDFVTQQFSTNLTCAASYHANGTPYTNTCQ